MDDCKNWHSSTAELKQRHVVTKVKVKGQYICIVPYCRQPASKALRYGNALSTDLTVLPVHPRVYPRMEWTIPAFAFPAEAGTHLPTRRDGRLSWSGQPERWVNTRSRTATQCLSRLLKSGMEKNACLKAVYKEYSGVTVPKVILLMILHYHNHSSILVILMAYLEQTALIQCTINNDL